MESKITFARLVKEEIVENSDLSTPRLKSLLSAVYRIGGVISFKNKKTVLVYRTENAKIAKFIFSSLKKLYPNLEISLDFFKKNNIKKRTNYRIVINDADSLLEDLSINFIEGKISKDIVNDDETIAGYLAGAFLAGGSINSPETSNYHLEISVIGENYAKWLSKLFGKYKKIEMEPRVTKRREKYIVYFKKSDQISNFLVIVGATNSCMEFENARAYRDYSNNTNRLMNLDMANMSKTLKISQQQIEEIKYIDDVLGIHNFHNTKKELLCYFRLDNESLSMQDLADKLSDELGMKVTKSNVNHLFRDLHELYLKLKGRNI